MYTVYALIDPRTYEVKYIGITTNPQSRLNEHMNAHLGYYPNEKKVQWTRELRQAKLKIILLTLEKAKTYKEVRIREKFWIRYYRTQNTNLLNREIHL